MKCENKEKKPKKQSDIEKLTGEKLEQVAAGGAFDDMPRMDDKDLNDDISDRA